MITFYLYMNINEVISFLLLIRLVLTSSPLKHNIIRIYPPIKCLPCSPLSPLFSCSKIHAPSFLSTNFLTVKARYKITCTIFSRHHNNLTRSVLLLLLRRTKDYRHCHDVCWVSPLVICTIHVPWIGHVIVATNNIYKHIHQ